MKKKLFVSLISLASLGLVACSGTISSNSTSGNGCPSVDSVACPDPETVVVHDTVEVPVELKYTLTVDADTDVVTVNFDDDFNVEEVSAGSTVTFDLFISDEVNYKLGDVTIGGTLITPNDVGKYSFIMPNFNATLKIDTMDTGASDILQNPDVDETTLPKSFDELKAKVQASSLLETKYLASAKIEDNSTSSTNVRYETVAGTNTSVTKSYTVSSKTGGSRNAFDVGTTTQSGIVDGYFYSIVTSPVSEGKESGLKDVASTYKIVSDETEKTYDLRYLAKETDAKKAASTFYKGGNSSLTDTSSGVANYVLASTLFSDSFSDSDRYTVTVGEPKVAEDKKSFSIKLTSERVMGGTYYLAYYTITFDSIGFMTNVDYQSYTYDSASYTTDGSTYTINDGAMYKTHYYMTVEAERGFKNDNISGLKDIHNYVLDDYDIHLIYTKPSTSTTVDAIDGSKVEMGGKVSYTVTGTNAAAIKPVINSLPEGMFTYTNLYDITPVTKGTGTIVFDNGLGVLKEVPVEVIDAQPTKITATLGETQIYVGNETTLSASVTPAAASQAYTVTKSSDSVGDVDLTKNDDGTYTVKAVAEGSVTLDVVSDYDPTIKTSVTLNCLIKPVKDTVISNITTKSVYGYNTTVWGTGTTKIIVCAYINFNSDGTGEFRYAYKTDSSYSSWSLKDVSAFKWTVDDNLKFTITTDATAHKLNSFEAIANTAFNFQVQGPYNYANVSGAGIVDRTDLSTLTTSNMVK